MTTQEMVQRIRDNPTTTAIGIVSGALYAVGDYLHNAGVEPFGGLVLGLGACVGVAGLFLARDGKSKAAP